MVLDVLHIASRQLIDSFAGSAFENNANFFVSRSPAEGKGKPAPADLVRKIVVMPRNVRVQPRGLDAKKVQELEFTNQDVWRLQPLEPRLGIPKLIQLHAHPVHDRKIEAAQFPVVITRGLIVQHAARFERPAQPAGRHDR